MLRTRFSFRLARRCVQLATGLLIGGGCSPLCAQSIAPERVADWSRAGVEGGIPDITATDAIFDVTAYGAVANDQGDDRGSFTKAMVAAIQSGHSPAVVYFPPGEYRFSSGIRVAPGIVVRGHSAEDTRLVFDMAESALPCFDTPIFRWGDYVDVTGGTTQGSRRITVADASSFVVGQWLELEEDNNAALMYTESQWNQSWAAYAKGQFVRVTAVAGNQVSFDRPLKTTFNPARHLRARRGELAEWIGFENFHIERVDRGDSYFFYLKNCANVWLRGISALRCNKAHVWTERAVNFEIRGCYFERAYDYGGDGHGYGVSLGHHSHDGLIENNIFNRLRHHMIVSKGASGNVFGYNTSFDRVQGSDLDNLNDGWIPPDISIHGHWSNMNLFEGNVSQEIHSADFWGPSGPGTTFFRNRLEAAEGVTVDDHSVDQNFVGNELVAGTFDIDASVTGTFLHGNNVQGAIAWDGVLGPTALVDSLYLTRKPAWWGASAWPSIGPEFTLGSGSNPARDRWLAGGVLTDGSSGRQVEIGDGLIANLSTRAWIEGGDKPAIAGFVVAGPGARTLLVRGVGPTLSTLGVSATLDDPMMQVFDADGRLLAENDDWAAEVAVFASKVGAFALEAGSKDAALVRRFEPGIYTVHVRDTGLRTGIVLIEVFVAD